ncbi:MAG TPA: acetyl-CoA hydrolase/transferase C-terminal domain-containing protein [Amycolatopsis sp.]|uniref:acetyl-CoA hydrolase/transferase C-terminal domain-containing protein n=1 Tax=Amycolatopsis sp. TaxID=37632 RepID=UPI002B4A4F57|nr:acetyl-CoA hydrolase/transferase C-terminal domain-containing protein [Amycolatopsis sp.]HKS46983.1 acetyl-CoA hydrolase/transferase C-terminal domain-containing protein [Amycolatopsis sp.]
MTELDRLVRPGSRIALGDGCGTPVSLHAELSRVAAGHGVRVVLGWMPGRTHLDAAAFADTRVLMGGQGVRSMVDSGAAQLVPCRLSAVPALLRGPLRPDLLVATLVRRSDGLHLGAESSWMRGLIEAGVPVAASLSTTTPAAEAGPPVPARQVTVVEETDESPAEIPNVAPTAVDVAIARNVAELVPAGARIQVGPGRLAQAIVGALEVPVRVDSGLLPDPVVDLDAKGLLIGEPVAAYLCGTRRLYEWADGRRILHPIETTHDIGRLSASGAPPLIAVNAALEIDQDGQVNSEGIGDKSAGMIGGHPDFCAAAVRGPGLSVIAMASMVRGSPTLVERLSRSVTTCSHDLDIVVNERGITDLRGLSRSERRATLLKLWDGQITMEG